ncbi:MAG: RNA polymerase sigma factor [Streptomycetaceae bacterium]|nr:RNA polymerase sigma factor [Streptomycetaceae bacterium]
MADYKWPAEQIILGAQRGDEAALTALVSGSHPHVRRFADALCASPQDAEDAAQEALIILYRKIGMLRATGALASWMFRIVRNECLRRTRGVLRTPPYDPPPAQTPGGEPALESVENDVLRRLEVERVAAAIAQLPEDLRRVLVMRDVQGYPGRTVARALGLSTAAMKSRLHRARAALRKALGEPTTEGGR